jgi:hypothetical protein
VKAAGSRDAFFALPREDQAAIVEFLRTLRVVPDGSPPVSIETAPDGRLHQHRHRFTPGA